MRTPLRVVVSIAAAVLQLAGAARVLAQAADANWTDALRPGAGVSIPRLLKEVKPAYTAEAVAAKVQGTVWVECVVEVDGTVRRIRVVRSLDSRFGLDEEAVAAVKKWQFDPARRMATRCRCS